MKVDPVVFRITHTGRPFSWPTTKATSIELFAYLTDVLRRLPKQPAGDIDELRRYNWRPATDNSQD